MKRRVQFNGSDLMANRKNGRNEGAWVIKDWENKFISRETFSLHIFIDPSWQQREGGQGSNTAQLFNFPNNSPTYKHRPSWCGKTCADLIENHETDCANFIPILNYYSLVVSRSLEEGKSDICLYVYYIYSMSSGLWQNCCLSL